MIANIYTKAQISILCQITGVRPVKKQREKMKLTIKSKLIGAFIIILALMAGIFGAGYISLNSMDKTADRIISQAEPDSGDTATLPAEKDAAYSRGLLLMIIVTAAAGAVLLVSVVYVIWSHSRELKTVRLALAKMATGDLTQKMNLKSKDESGKIAAAYNELQRQMSELVTRIKSGADQLAVTGEQLSAAARQSSESTRQVATSSQQIAKGAQEESVNAQETAVAVARLNGIINQVSSAAGEQSAGVRKAVNEITSVSQTLSLVAKNADVAAQGAKQATELTLAVSEKNKLNLSGIEKIKLSTEDAARKIEELGSRSQEIGSIVAVIDEIASQTNLLALNAAIEAARAGDQGLGFAVVSDEVRKLAERTAIATQEIAGLISHVQKDIQEAATVMAGGTQAVSEGYELATQAGQSLERIRRVAAGVNLQVEQISTKSQQVYTAAGEAVKTMGSIGSISEQTTEAAAGMSAAAVQVSKAIETVAGIAQENSAATQQVSASAQEMSSHSQELEASSQALKAIAAELENSIVGFRVRG
jgi:methyl-accepting chemotaxis protein